MQTILIVGRDLGFAFWLGQILDSGGYDAFPARTVQDATDLVRYLPAPIDLLVVDPETDGIAGFVAAARLTWPLLSVIAAYEQERPEDLLGLDGTFQKPSVPDGPSEKIWLEMVGHLLRRNPK